MKQVAMGRKAWLFVCSVLGGEQSAKMMTLVSSARRHDLDVELYIKDVLDQLLAGKQAIVAGVIDTTTNYIEHPEEIAERLKRVASVVGDPKRVIAGTDCGFDTSAGAGKVAEEIVWAKLASLAEGARIASRNLF